MTVIILILESQEIIIDLNNNPSEIANLQVQVSVSPDNTRDGHIAFISLAAIPEVEIQLAPYNQLAENINNAPVGVYLTIS